MLIGILLFAVLLLEVAAAECIPGFERKNFATTVCSLGASLCISLAGVLYLSLVRNIKCHKFIKRSIVYKIAAFIFRILKKLLCRLAKLADRIKNAAKFFSSRHSAVFSSVVFWIYSVCLTVLGAADPFLAICFAAVSFAVLAISAKKYFTDFDKIKEGVNALKSGNGEIASEKLNLSTLIAQAMAEEENEILKSGLDFYSSCPDNLSVLCEGRKMSRVFSNLITNAVLYSLPGTRVYIISYEKDGFITTEIKNISSYKMDFDSDEITERFVRGDKSRTTEGSGLGLCIAKSYTEACGGKFHVVTDGDLFKAVVTLKKA